MAIWSLGRGAQIAATVTGGLSFFGGPLNNYMSHAVCAMTRVLRSGAQGTGLLYGQGGFVNKHHALILGNQPAPRPLALQYMVQTQADRARGPVPAFTTDFAGAATLETFTILYDRDGAISHGVAIARTCEGSRLMAKVLAEDSETLDALTQSEHSAVGMQGWVRKLANSSLQWRVR
jgi:hypothetical protein